MTDATSFSVNSTSPHIDPSLAHNVQLGLAVMTEILHGMASSRRDDDIVFHLLYLADKISADAKAALANAEAVYDAMRAAART